MSKKSWEDRRDTYRIRISRWSGVWVSRRTLCLSEGARAINDACSRFRIKKSRTPKESSMDEVTTHGNPSGAAELPFCCGCAFLFVATSPPHIIAVWSPLFVVTHLRWPEVVVSDTLRHRFCWATDFAIVSVLHPAVGIFDFAMFSPNLQWSLWLIQAIRASKSEWVLITIHCYCCLLVFLRR